jgi:hypothetical protein
MTQCQDENTNDTFHLTTFRPGISSIPFISQNMRLLLVPLRKVESGLHPYVPSARAVAPLEPRASAEDKSNQRDTIGGHRE